MILCSYTLALTCDSTRHYPIEDPPTAQYTARTRAVCVEQARADGWWLWKGKATCPRCFTPGTKPTRANSHEDNDALVLRMIHASHGPVIAADLARQCSLAPSTMTRALRRLEASGSIRKTRRTRTSAWWVAV